MMIRSFIAIDFPEETRKALGDVQRELKQCGAGVRWVKPRSIHLTLKFLDNIHPTQVEDIALAVAQEIRDQPPITLRPAGLGAFPSRRKPRVIWIGMEGEVQRLKGIQSRVENALEPLSFVREKRPFRPHLTIGRVKDRRRLQSLIDSMAELKIPEFDSFDVTEIILYKSDLRPTGAIYTKLHRMSLAASASV
jgi:2'-5' RNA ligase